jgi:hypothetical protein
MKILNLCNSNNGILIEFGENLNTVEIQTNSFIKYENVVSDWKAAEGFYLKLQESILYEWKHWEYVANQMGGFIGFWYHCTSPPISPGKRISQDELIPHIIKVLQKHGGRARKDQVEEEIYQMFKDIFKEPYYQETVSIGVPRWQHNIAWAKERAKKRRLIKRPEESGRGFWEFTEKGMKMT